MIRALAGNNGKRICAFLTSVVDYARDRMDAQHCGREAIADISAGRGGEEPDAVELINEARGATGAVSH